ncbi:assimilatory sulfite reductase (NADPH) flavoprotein subunit [Aquibacillus albus]|uniref:Sulfite reductase (NADPH) flavoprotein alpha-component n=1 Tax=Aquibacillus albus TaxID=1168171 RepID=A0ABS2MX56_9BACI|nr:assimilatory sulfite reductase (NADPH) flavoprotein subunit [Aquibacillus albus]MBM7570470.1 sulfite reductase (NADPH) flavoprotein alpha-component [Aquibacillus albus]
MQLQVMNSPFSQEQVELLNRLLPTLTENQKIWLSGYLAVPQPGQSEAAATTLEDAIEAEPTTSANTEVETREVTILFGTDTGNAQALAEEFSQKLEQQQLKVTVSCFDDFKPKALKKVEDLLIVTSTHGDGDPPDNALSFYDFLHSKRAPKLEGVRFSVLALGDSSYEFFCQTGKDFDKRLEELGAERIYPRVDCDLDFEEPAAEWFEAVFDKLGASSSSTQASGIDQTAVDDDQPSYSRSNPFRAEVLENINLNGRGSNKETRHVELDLEDSNLVFEPGDSLGVYPENDPDLVDELIETMGWNAEESIPINKQGDLYSLREALTSTFEITTLTKPLLEKAAQLTNNEELKSLIQPENKEALTAYIEGRDLIDFVRDFGPWQASATDFINILRKIPVRLYSIASSLKAYEDEVHLTIGTVRYHAHGRDRTGVCSGQCAERIEVGDSLKVFVQKNPNFRLPENPDTPVIMIGPGTGVAPYRAFLQEREEIGAEGDNWLFFGEQHFMTDFLYQTEWQQWLKDGVLSRMDVAFSRDTDEKVYVQHRMLEKSREFYQWLEAGAHVYVCGDEKHMAKDVHATILSILEKEGGMSQEEAEAFLTDMRKQKRYQRDVY